MSTGVHLPDGIAAGLTGVHGVHHIGIAVRDLDASLAVWSALTGGQLELRAVVAEQSVEAACLEWPTGGMPTVIELIAPTNEASGVHRFLERRGEGLHHVALAVTNTAQTLEAAIGAGFRAIDVTPRIGLHGTPVAFLHPAAATGVLVELVEISAPG